MRKLAWGREWRGSRLLLLTLTPGGGKTDINVPILEIRKLRQALVQGYPAKKWPTNLRSHNQSLVELKSFSFLGKNELFPLKSAFPFLSVSLIVVLLLSSGNNILHLWSAYDFQNTFASMSSSHKHPQSSSYMALETTRSPQRLQESSAPGVTTEPGARKNTSNCTCQQTGFRKTQLYPQPLREFGLGQPYSISCDLLPWPRICRKMDTDPRATNHRQACSLLSTAWEVLPK